MACRALDRAGNPLPWYTYPCIDFLSRRTYADRSVLEFGAGQSTLWWGARAASVVSFEGDAAWHRTLLDTAPANASLHHVAMGTAAECLDAVRAGLATHSDPTFDIVVIDGLWRQHLVEVAIAHLKPRGAIICDNAAGYAMGETFAGTGFSHVDFYGTVPGVVLPDVTSIFFRSDCFLFDEEWPLEVR